MTLDNLRGELSDPDQVGRIDLVAAEVRRLARLLSELLDSARSSEEAPRRVEVRAVAEGTAALVRCQVPDSVKIETRVAPGVFARVPEDRFRQALLNLCLNAVQAIAEGFRHLGYRDDHEINGAEWIVYDALFAYCREMTSQGKANGAFKA